MKTYPDRLELKKGSGRSFGCASSIFGLAFIFVGIVVLVLNSSPEHIEHHSIYERILGGFVAFAFMFAGTVFAFGKNGIDIDSSQRIIREWNGVFFFRFSTDTFPLEDFDCVTIEKKGPSNFMVFIEGEDEMVTLFTSSSYSVARERAETIAAFVSLDCNDEVQELIEDEHRTLNVQR